MIRLTNLHSSLFVGPSVASPREMPDGSQQSVSRRAQFMQTQISLRWAARRRPTNSDSRVALPIVDVPIGNSNQLLVIPTRERILPTTPNYHDRL